MHADMRDIIRMSNPHAHHHNSMTIHVLQADQSLKTKLITTMSKLDEQLADIDSSDPVKTAFQEGRRGGMNMFQQEPLEIVAESKYEVCDHTYQVRDSKDKVLEERLSPTSWKISIKPKTGRLG